MAGTATTTSTTTTSMDDACFVAPEGVYSLTDEHKQPPQPTIITVPTLYPARLTTITVKYPSTSKATASSNAPAFVQLLGAGRSDNKKDKEKSSNNDGHSLSSSDNAGDEPPIADITNSNAAGSDSLQPQALFTDPSLSSGAHNVKRKSIARPKQNIRTTSSTFITRLQNAEGFPKMLQSKTKDASFMFYNYAKTFIWVDLDAKSKEPLAKVTFSQYPTCHDVNQSTASPERLDLIVGFCTGDLLWLDPISSRYTRINKQGSICNSPCTSVRWVPSSPTLFIASYANGTIVVYDKEREDGSFTVSEDPPEAEWDPIDSIYVTVPPWHPANMFNSNPGDGIGSGAVKEGGNIKAEAHAYGKTAKNPVSHWKVSRRKIVDFVFSPDVKYVAAISEDGCLRIIDAVAEQLVDCYASYFGALTCVAWSPDGRFVLTGGQDDLLTIFSPWEQRVIARCQGHSSFVSAVAFDELRCDGRTYRFGSVGEDNKLILWDFSSGALHRPKFHATHQQRMSMSSTISLALRRDRERSVPYLPMSMGMGSGASADGELTKFHPAPPRNEIAVVQPVLVKNIEPELLTCVTFLPRGVLTSTRLANIKVWVRPLPTSTGRRGVMGMGGDEFRYR